VLPELLAGVRIGVARDSAFSFIYPANLDLLRALGATLVFFRRWPMQRAGGRQPLSAPAAIRAASPVLQANLAMKAALQEHFRQGKPIYAECGGMLYLLEALTTKAASAARWLVNAGRAVMQNRLQGLAISPRRCRAGICAATRFIIQHSNTAAPHRAWRAAAKYVAGEAVFR